MIKYYSIDDIMDVESEGWKKYKSEYGHVFIPPADIGKGKVEVIGDIQTCYLSISGLTFLKDRLERTYLKEKGIQISFIDHTDISFYKEKQKMYTASQKTFLYINNVPNLWYHFCPANKPNNLSSFIIRENFFIKNGLAFENHLWNYLANTFNNKDISIPEIGAICLDIKHMTLHKDALDFYLKAKVFEIMAILIDYAKRQGTNKILKLNQAHYNMMEEAKKIIHKDIINPPIIEDLAKCLKVNKKKLQLMFKQATGKTIGEYIKTARMEKALLLLETTDLNITQISKNVGYQSRINFYNAFKHTFKMTPVEMKKRLFG